MTTIPVGLHPHKFYPFDLGGDTVYARVTPEGRIAPNTPLLSAFHLDADLYQVDFTHRSFAHATPVGIVSSVADEIIGDVDELQFLGVEKAGASVALGEEIDYSAITEDSGGAEEAVEAVVAVDAGDAMAVYDVFAEDPEAEVNEARAWVEAAPEAVEDEGEGKEDL